MQGWFCQVAHLAASRDARKLWVLHVMPKNKNQVRGPPNPEAFKRIQYLLNASHSLSNSAPALSRFYCNTAREVGKKLVIRLFVLLVSEPLLITLETLQ